MNGATLTRPSGDPAVHGSCTDRRRRICPFLALTTNVAHVPPSVSRGKCTGRRENDRTTAWSPGGSKIGAKVPVEPAIRRQSVGARRFALPLALNAA